MDDHARVAELIGRQPRGEFDVVVRDSLGGPVVVRNAPFLDDGTPMPTRYYLVGAELVRAVSRIEAAGGVRRAESEIAAEAIAAAHAAYERERDAAIAADHTGPTPYGGVGGTRRGVKCLHAHVAHLLAGGEDPVGAWTLAQLANDAGVLDGLVPPAPSAGASAATPDAATPDAATPDAANPNTGGLTVRIADDHIAVEMTGGGAWTLPVGTDTLLDGELERADPPPPANLTNALGIVHDHLDDILVMAPSILATPSVVLAGVHAEALAMVELGHTDVPADYRLARADADEVFRTLVVEPTETRRFNPGLPPAHVESIIATLCIVLTFMRRLELGEVGISIGGQPWH